MSIFYNQIKRRFCNVTALDDCSSMFIGAMWLFQYNTEFDHTTMKREKAVDLHEKMNQKIILCLSKKIDLWA